MYLSGNTPGYIIRKAILENEIGDQLTMIPAANFGDIYIAGENHKEAAEYFKEKIKECKTKGDEIRLHFEIREKFDVALYNDQ